jgi:hypothetical protein
MCIIFSVYLHSVRTQLKSSEVITAITMPSTIFWDNTVYSHVLRRFEGMYRLHLQGQTYGSMQARC